MPIFHDHDGRPHSGAARRVDGTLEQLGEPRQRAGDKFLGEHLPRDAEGNQFYPTATLETPSLGIPGPLSREELIRRIKRGESPNHGYGRRLSQSRSRPPSRSSSSRPRTPVSLLPPPDFREGGAGSKDVLDVNFTMGLEIPRPRSALHSGDFSETGLGSAANEEAHLSAITTASNYGSFFATSPVAPWHQAFPAVALRSDCGSSSSTFAHTVNNGSRFVRARATSNLSLSSNFDYKPPTSPLIQQSNSADLDFSKRIAPSPGSRSPDRNRRHTFSPRSLQALRTSTDSPLLGKSPGRTSPSMRREGTFPYQAHQPRRSLTSFSSLPQTPLLGSRRPSVADLSPLQHAPMVGSYEESILRGRMSTLPSRPLNFMAQIGVLGKGSCRPNLRCPPHSIVPFPAVFYSYGNGNGRRAISDDQPSPYVGLIDLENNLKKPDDLRETRPKRPFHNLHDEPDGHHDLSLNLDSDALVIAEQRKREKRKRMSASPRTPPGGSYRIPQQGQLQVVIKNPNKTAVKLFLIPYDLSDMEPGQKTFIRQRSYSAGSIIDMPLSSRTNLGTDRPEAALSASDDPRDRPTLRYLIHLHICCPSRGRFYLYKSIRVVFANRVPDGKEKLRNEIQLPEPRYSTYKPGRESAPDPTKPHPTEHAVTGTGSPFPSHIPNFDHPDGIPQDQTSYSAIYPKSTDLSSATPTRPLPFTSKRPRIPPLDSRPASRGLSDRMDVDSRDDTASDGDLQSPVSAKSSFAALMDCVTSGDASDVRSNGGGGYEKLSRGDVGYGGSAFSHFGNGGGGGSVGRAESLLAKRLRGLDVRCMSGDEEEMS